MTPVSVSVFSSRLRVVRIFRLFEKTKLRVKRKVLFWATIACTSSRRPAGTGRRPRSQRDIGNLCAPPSRPCLPLVIPMAVRHYGSWSMPARVSRIALKSCSVGRGTPSGMNASRRFINRLSFPAQWAEEAHRPARGCHDRHSDYSRRPPHRSQVHGRVAIADG